MDSSFAADCGKTHSGDCGTGDCGKTSTNCGANSTGDTGGDCCGDSGKDCADTKQHSTKHDYTYTDFASGPHRAVAGPSESPEHKTQPDTSTSGELQLREEQIEARARKERERKEKIIRVLHKAKFVAANIIKGKF
jgi:hypothetical protein